MSLFLQTLVLRGILFSEQEHREEQRQVGSVNRSVRRVMVGVAGLAVLGMSATLAGEQTVEVKEKPPLYRYVSYWTFPRAHWGDVDKDNATGNQKIPAPALADVTLVGRYRIICRAIRASQLEA